MIAKINFAGKEVWPFTIPSGIVTTQVSSLEKIAREVPHIGILTTKSIGPEPRVGNREPIILQYSEGCFMNAVGLTNLGAEEFAKDLKNMDFPKDKFLLASIFGGTPEEFVYVAKTLEDYVDGFELNFSCPHVSGHGMAIGTDPEIVGEYIRKITEVTKLPLIAKLTPNVNNIGYIARAAMIAGAFGISAINTVGPGYLSIYGHDVLTNKVGGMSGRGIMPLGLKSVRDARQAIGEEPFVLGMGGITYSEDVAAFMSAGANAVGVGSSLAGMNDREVKDYFEALSKGHNVKHMLKDVNMYYRETTIVKKENLADDFKVFRTDYDIDARPGQFVFAWLPRVGEKPFSIVDTDPLTLAIQERGEFTKAFNQLEKGDKFYFRGPHGTPINRDFSKNHILVGGGCGIAGITHIAERVNESGGDLRILLGAKDKQHIPYLKRLEELGDVYVATEDGSYGIKGMVTDLFSEVHSSSIFAHRIYNCGPKAMLEAVLPIERKFANPENIFSSLDYITSCGVGLCGKCADDKGRRTCVEGPFMSSK